jgi:predicted Zn-ribbon and HTH transcriptional regulator
MPILLDCPQCGGEITFDEEIEVVRCPFCASAHQIFGKSGQPRFMLLPRWDRPELTRNLQRLLKDRDSLRAGSAPVRTLYAPFWRTRGMVFRWVFGKRESLSPVDGRREWDDAKELQTKMFDLSFPAWKRPSLGLDSLGVRPSALPLRLFHPSRLSGNELVLPTEVSTQEAMRYSSSFLTFGFADGSLTAELEDTQLIGETYALIYFPFWLLEVKEEGKTGLLVADAMANRVTKVLWDEDLSGFPPAGKRPEDFATLRLMPARCPVCAWDFQPSTRSKVHVCLICARAWAEYEGSYREVPYQLADLPATWKLPVRYLPFWNLETRIRTAQALLRTQGDLRKLAPNLQGSVDQSKMTDPIRFLVPAFRIKSMPALLKLASLFSLRPPEANLRVGDNLANRRFEGVDLPGTEAIEAARVVLLSLLPRYSRAARLLLKDASLEAAPPRLVYYPFHRKGLHLREVNSDHSIQHGTVSLTPIE